MQHDEESGGQVRWHSFFHSAYAGGGFTLGAGYTKFVSPHNMLDTRGSITFTGYKRIETEFIAPGTGKLIPHRLAWEDLTELDKWILLKRNATVTVCHTKTRDLAGHTRTADILVAAAGRANLVTREMVKPGAAVVDVSTNWVDGRQVGDLGPGVEEVAGWLTPNPGGVGPMTRAMLIKNTYEAEVRRYP